MYITMEAVAWILQFVFSVFCSVTDLFATCVKRVQTKKTEQLMEKITILKLVEKEHASWKNNQSIVGLYRLIYCQQS